MSDDKTNKGTADSSSPKGCQTAGNEAPPPSTSPQDGAQVSGKQASSSVAEGGAQASGKKQNKKSKSSDDIEKAKKVLAALDKKFAVVKLGGIIKPAVQYRQCLNKLGIKFRFHRYARKQISFDNGKTWRSFRDDEQSALYADVQDKSVYWDTQKMSPVGVVVSVAERKAAVNLELRENVFSPLEDWFNKLPAKKYPTDLINEIFKHNIDASFLSKDSVTVYRAAKRYCQDWCETVGIGVYLRTMRPGSSFQFLPTIVGPQGCGKGTFCRGLIPAHLRSELVKDGLNITTSIADMLEACQAGVIMECAELAGFGRKEINKLKAFISGENTTARRAYGEETVTYQRHHIIIATTNDSECMAKDPTGHRRWLLMPVTFREDWDLVGVKNNLLKTMDGYLEMFWSSIKYLVEVEGRDASYEHWHPNSLKIRDHLCGQHERRHYSIEAALDNLLTPPGCYTDHDVLLDDERRNGILFDVPKSSSKRSIMKLLPKEITSKYSKDLISKIITEMKWVTISRPTIDGVKCSRKKPPLTSIMNETISIDSACDNGQALDKVTDKAGGQGSYSTQKDVKKGTGFCGDDHIQELRESERGLAELWKKKTERRIAEDAASKATPPETPFD